MIQKLLFLTFLLMAAEITSWADDKDLQQYYRQIYEAIDHSPEYVAQHEQKIGDERRALAQEATQEGRFLRNFRLYELYKPFVSDSAMYFLRQCIILADRMGDHSAAVRCRALLAVRSSNIGMYDEALIFLDSIRTE